jgi:hypothetical protein
MCFEDSRSPECGWSGRVKGRGLGCPPPHEGDDEACCDTILTHYFRVILFFTVVTVPRRPCCEEFYVSHPSSPIPRGQPHPPRNRRGFKNTCETPKTR